MMRRLTGAYNTHFLNPAAAQKSRSAGYDAGGTPKRCRSAATKAASAREEINSSAKIRGNTQAVYIGDDAGQRHGGALASREAGRLRGRPAHQQMGDGIHACAPIERRARSGVKRMRSSSRVAIDTRKMRA